MLKFLVRSGMVTYLLDFECPNIQSDSAVNSEKPNKNRVINKMLVSSYWVWLWNSKVDRNLSYRNARVDTD